MAVSLELQRLERPGYTIELFVPNAQQAQEVFLQQKELQAATPFPHWTKLWPSSLALADYLQAHPVWVANKQVLELAAGLGLPSFIAARRAKAVCCSDYLEAAVAAMKRSAQQLQLSNVTPCLLDWNHLPDELRADVLLLSDINYDPDQFDHLFLVLQRFLSQGTTILLTTPQRLMAKPFIEKLLPWCRLQEELMVDHLQQQTPVSLLVLKEGGE